jgi:hypothetical protein
MGEEVTNQIAIVFGVQRIAHPVEQRCRTVTPLYRLEPKAS